MERSTFFLCSVRARGKMNPKKALVNRTIVLYNNEAHRRAPSFSALEGFSQYGTKQFKKVNALDLLAFKNILEDNMAFADSIKRFPIVKVIPLKAFDAGEDALGETTLIRGMVANALVSFKDIESIWEVDHDSTDLKDKFQKLYYQLDSLKKYCEGDGKPI
jgi:hypothetical protein